MAVFKVDTDALLNLSKSVSDQKQTIEGLSKKYTTLTSHTNKIIDNGPYAIPNAGTVQNTNEAINTGHTNVVKHYSQTIENISSIVIQAKIADFLATSFPPSLDSLNPLKVMKDFISDKLGFLFDGKEKTKEEKLMEETFKDTTPQEYAMLSNLAYRSSKNMQAGLKKYGLSDKFSVEKIDGKKVNSYPSGLDVVVFTNKNTNESIVAFRGTEPSSLSGFITDAKEDITGVLGINSRFKSPFEDGLKGAFSGPPQFWFLPRLEVKGNNIESKQYRDAKRFMQRLEGKLGDTSRVTFTGHSLGGWVATTMADKEKRPAVTFNAPQFYETSTFYKGSKERYLQNDYQNIVNFKTDTDIVSKENKYTGMEYAPGITLSVPNVGSSALFSGHGIVDNFQFNSQGNILVNEGQGDFAHTATIDESSISAEKAKILSASPISPHYYFDGMTKKELLDELNKGIENYKKLAEFKSIGGEYANTEKHKDFVK
ncbi:hypothetical protein [Priestia endophytica]|uniref:hypothetical protein n=1 Tax=Priestia endophytica TaxID=135735 RepID=UPI000DCA6182|nr:hypothetical protein [Priestia endophytica]RAS82589.1 hypothetical protein A4R27_08815 [Priestia endophytica]